MKENLHLKTLKIIIIFISIIALLFGIIFFIEQAINFLDSICNPIIRNIIILSFIFVGIYYFIYMDVKEDYERQKYYENLIKKREQNKED